MGRGGGSRGDSPPPPPPSLKLRAQTFETFNIGRIAVGLMHVNFLTWWHGSFHGVLAITSNHNPRSNPPIHVG